ncbi:MAG: universal stress protein [Ectothiorhodospiraceae bacterium]|nr:universal stress protein [Ectothiorhodospiraceae bacterium]MCH8504655.1 universal stress protein [Ectothiorhodospiraceae bacterium]
MFEHTVVAAHFSSATAPLFDSLRELQDRGTRELTLVDVLRSHNTADLAEEHRVEAQRRLEEEKTELERAGFKVNIELRMGQPAHELSTIARGRGASLILVGSRGEHYFREFLRGSTVLQLVRKTSTPVLLEPIEADIRQVRARGFSRVLLATDFSASVRDAEQMAVELADKAAELVLLHVVEDDDAEELGEERAVARAREKLAEIAKRLPQATKLTQRVERGVASRQIMRVADEENSSMLVIGKRGDSPVRELMLGSTAQAVVRNASQSVLVVPSSLGQI